MRGMLHLLGIIFVGFLVIVVLTGTVSFIRHTWFDASGHSGKRVAVVDLTGVILSSQSFLDDLEEKVDDSGVKAIVIRINSPGGMVAPSQEMYNAIREADAKKPVIISMASVAASGGYYAALGGRKIFASPGTLTASIGVIMEFLNTQKLYEWAKVQRFTITAGEMKDAGSPLKPMTAEEKKMFQAMLSDIHEQFRAAVKERRKVVSPELEKFTDGRVMTGNQALAAKLIDALGGLHEALLDAKKTAGLSADAAVEMPHRSTGLLRKLVMGEDNDGGESHWTGFLGALMALVSSSGSHTLPAAVSPGWQVLLKAPIQ